MATRLDESARRWVDAIDPDAVRDVWERDLAGLDPEFVQAVLAVADSLRDGNNAARLRAHAVYVALADRLDPSAPEDAARMAFTLVARSLFDWMDRAPGFATRAVAAGAGRVRFRGRLVLAQLAATRGEMEAAGEAFIRLLAESRGTSEESRVCRSLVTYFSLCHRDFEALVFAGRAVRLAVHDGDVGLECTARAHLCFAVSAIGDTVRLATELAELDRVIAIVGDDVEALPLRYASMLRADLGIASGDAALARNALERLERLTAFEHLSRHEQVSRLQTRAELALLEGRPDRAREHVRQIETLGAPYANSVVVRKGLELRASAADTPHEQRRALAAEILDLVEMHADELGAGQVIDLAGGVGDHLAADPVFAAEVRRAYDIAALAILRRIVEIDCCVRELPELTDVSPADRATLARARDEFARNQHRVLARVHKLILDDARTGRRPLEALEGGRGVIVVCAWCRRVGTPDGHWLPIGHFIPRQPDLRLTHGICPDCLPIMRPNRATGGRGDGG